MSGHSKWSQIKRQKGVADQKRGQTFTKLANAITIATKLGGSGDPDVNPRLRMAIEEARSVNMPKDNIQRAIDRGLGKLPGQALEEVLYEGFGPFRAAFIVEGVTDNRMRTTAEVKNVFERFGGAMASQGSVAYMFDRVGEIKVRGREGGRRDEEILELIDLGAEDVEDYLEDGSQKYLVYVPAPQLNVLSNKITQSGFNLEGAELIYRPNTTLEVADRNQLARLMEFTEKLESLDDVHKVFTNFDIPDNLLEE